MVKNKKLILIVILFFTVTDVLSAGQFDAGFQQGKNAAINLNKKSFNTLKNFDPNTYFKTYTDQPKEIKYRNNFDSLKDDAGVFAQSDETAKDIQESQKKRPKFDIKSDSPEIQNVNKKANDIYDVVTGQFGDCIKKEDCSISYTNISCEETPNISYQYCKKTLNIDLNPKKEETNYKFSLHIETDYHDYAGLNVNAVTGKIGFKGPHDTSFRFSGRLPGGIDCQSLTGKIISYRSKNSRTKLDYLNFPSCANGLNVDLHLSGHGRINLDIDFQVTSTKIITDPVDRWNDDCGLLSNSNTCMLKEERCLEENTTHNVSGINVTRTCWEKELSYQCGIGGENQCEPLRAQGCEQIGSICISEGDGNCIKYSQSFRCPQKDCKNVGMICNGATYCLDGNCVAQQKKADPDFQKAVSALSATQSAAKDFSQTNNIFSGVKKTCDKFVLGFLDCCKDKGWGKDHIVSCSQEEKDLKQDKDNGLTIYVGEYCKKDLLGKCLEHRKAYCVFPSKLARIIQNDGRRHQLNISFGDPEKANCRGITVSEFAQIDLNKVNFSDFYADINAKMKIENQADLNTRISEKMKTWEEGGTSHEK